MGQRLMIRGERKSPGSLQAIASYKPPQAAVWLISAIMKNQRPTSVFDYCFSIRLYASHPGVDFKAIAFIDEN
jgi:hypothetical protein